MPGTRKLGRTSDHRRAMLRAMVTYLFENGKIETTVTRAKEVRAMAEKMIPSASRTPCTRKDRSSPLSPKRRWQRKYMTRSRPSTPTETAATPASSKPALAGAMPRRWRSSNWSDRAAKRCCQDAAPGSAGCGVLFYCSPHKKHFISMAVARRLARWPKQ